MSALVLVLYLFVCNMHRFSFPTLIFKIATKIVAANLSPISFDHGRYKSPSPEWSVFREASFGHGELKMVNSTHAFWSWHRNDDDEPVKSDQVWITSLVGAGCVAEKKNELRKILMAP